MKRTFTVWMPKGWDKNDDGSLLNRLGWNEGMSKEEAEYQTFGVDKLKVEKVRVTVESKGGPRG